MPPAAALAPAACPLPFVDPFPLTRAQRKTLSRPEAYVTLRTPRQAWRAHWIPQAAWSACRAGLEERGHYATDVLPPCRPVQDGDGFWLLAEAGPLQAPPWLAPPALEPLEEVRRLAGCLDLLAAALGELHAQGLVWLTFDPSEIEFLPATALPPARAPRADSGRPAGLVRFTNLDLAVYPRGHCPERLPFNPKFAAPEVWHFRADELGSATDAFHLAAFAYYWLARLLPGGFFGAGLESFGFAFPPLRTFAPALPPGIAPVLARGLAVDPARRFPAPAALCAEVRAALDRAERRAASTAPVRWEAGSHTRPGKAKAALGRPNEDHALLRPFGPPPKALAAVADGISMCDVGRGDIASRTACEVLDDAFGPATTLDTFTATVPAVCHQAARALLDWAVRQGFRRRLLEGQDLMGTTLVTGWLEGNRVALANLGDSRAYLLDAGGIEQLTVDGDLGSALLAAGVPPEDVREIGPMAKALRDCVGGYTRSAIGELKIQEQHCTPTVTTWRLLPGDFLVLCTDGLLEEGVFLDPPALAELLLRHRDEPVQALAVRLADAADAMQRAPTPQEPEGFGDNISCIVIKVISP
jgi:serine/threonine protein phosphatase PrpC